MKLAFFDDFHLGIVNGESITDITGVLAAAPAKSPQDLLVELITRFAELRSAIEREASQGRSVPLSSVRLRPPAPKPGSGVRRVARGPRWRTVRSPWSPVALAPARIHRRGRMPSRQRPLCPTSYNPTPTDTTSHSPLHHHFLT